MWILHNAFKCAFNAYILADMMRCPTKTPGDGFILSNTYELLADPFVLLLTQRRNVGISLLAISVHHFATLVWSRWICGLLATRSHVLVILATRSLVYLSATVARSARPRFVNAGLKIVGITQLSFLMFFCYRHLLATDAHFGIFASELLFLKAILVCQLASLLLSKVGIVMVYRTAGYDVPVLHPLWAPTL
jgi:hypothetical protein